MINKFLLFMLITLSIIVSFLYVGFVKYYPDQKESSLSCKCIGIEKTTNGYCDSLSSACVDSEHLCKGLIVNC